MPWVRFTAPFDWHPKVGVIFAYQAGQVKLVTRRCAAEALAAGKAEKTVNPERRAAAPSRPPPQPSPLQGEGADCPHPDPPPVLRQAQDEGGGRRLTPSLKGD